MTSKDIQSILRCAINPLPPAHPYCKGHGGSDPGGGHTEDSSRGRGHTM